MTDQVIDVEAVEDNEVSVEEVGGQQVGALVPTGGTKLAVTPQVQATELVERLSVIKEAQEKAMVRDVDYGVIPGTDKPTLYKPGAEKLSVLFQLDVQLQNEKRWEGNHLTVISHATVFHAPTGTRLGYGEGVCTTRERKYAYRRQDRACPECGENTILESRKDPGWFCWRKKGGCGANFAVDDQRIVSQPEGEIDNPDLPDLWNTCVKMAEKRARVDAVLAVTGASALFTQDVEDFAPAGSAAPQNEQGAASPQQSGGKGRAAISDKQLGFLENLVKKQGVAGSELETLVAWAKANLTGGKGGTCSKAIDGLKTDTARTVDRLKKASALWAEEQKSPAKAADPGPESDLPAPDMEGLSDAEAGSDAEIPF
jgi:hypothetical protein